MGRCAKIPDEGPQGMNAFVWDESLSVDIHSLDDDHKHIIHLINTLDEAMASNECSEKLPGIFDQLLNYVLTHFGREEEYMRRIHFPGLKKHHILHEKLKSKLMQLKEQIESRDTGFLSLELSDFLRSWLLNHIALEDLQIRPYLAEADLTDKPDNELTTKVHPQEEEGIFRRLRLRHRISLLAVLQCIGVLFLGAIILLGSWQDVSDIRTATRINELVPLAGQLLTELQRERGLHSGLSQWGQSYYGQHLDEQKFDTDKAMARFLDAEPRSRVEGSDDSMARSLDNALRHLSQIESVRESSLIPGQTPRTIIDNFSQIVNALLNLVDDMVTNSVPEVARNSAKAYSALLHLREFMGQERALGSALFGTDMPSPIQVDWFSSLITTQSVYEHRFRLHAPADILALFNQRQSLPVSKQLQDLRQTILAPSIAIPPSDVDPLLWFDKATGNIDSIISIEGRLLDSLVNQTDNAFTYARNKLIAFGGAVVFLTFIIALIESVLARSIMRPLSELSQGMVKLAGGNRMARVNGISRDDELGELARAFEKFRSSLIRTDLAIAENKVNFSNIEYEKRFFSHLSQAVNQSPVSVVISDLDGRIEYVNRFYENVTGYQHKEAVGSSLLSILSDCIGKTKANGIWNRVLSGEVWEGEALLHTKSGKEYWELISLSSITGDDEMIGLVYIGQDITERKRTEEELRRSQKIQAMGQLTGGVAHDFNNLLGIILGNLQLLEADIGTNKRVVSAISAVQRGATLTQRLLAFSRRQTLAPEAVDINALVNGLADMLERTLGETIDLRQNLAPDLASTEVDPGQLENAIINLAINARDAMPGGGTLTIETANVTLEAPPLDTDDDMPPGDYVVVKVSDTGTGMDADIAARAFEPFFTTKEVGKGSGLGLSMVYGFVKQTGGLVRLQSELDRGTVLKLYFPGKPADVHENTEPDPTHETLPKGHENILVVEDNPDVRAVAVAVLERQGYAITEAVDGPAALACLDDDPFDLLFTDVVLPGGINGTELAEKICARQPSIKVLFTTGYAEDAITQDGRLDEGVTLITKPYGRDDLIKKVRAVLDEG